MQIGTLALFQRHGYPESVTDSQVYQEELRLAEQIEDLGYDSPPSTCRVADRRRCRGRPPRDRR